MMPSRFTLSFLTLALGGGTGVASARYLEYTFVQPGAPGVFQCGR